MTLALHFGFHHAAMASHHHSACTILNCYATAAFNKHAIVGYLSVREMVPH
jgi:hypothetical protein